MKEATCAWKEAREVQVRRKFGFEERIGLRTRDFKHRARMLTVASAGVSGHPPAAGLAAASYRLLGKVIAGVRKGFFHCVDLANGCSVFASKGNGLVPN
jgi:hypothetical protein